MLRDKLHKSGWQGVFLVAVTYVYFLIFAQFAFLKRLADLGVVGDHLQSVMAAMAVGGILVSLVAPRIIRWPVAAMRLRAALVAAAAAAALSLLSLGIAGAIVVSFLIGASLGLLTVTLVTHLRQFTGNRYPLMLVGLGTGMGYFVCNLPALFTASPQAQAIVAGALCLAGALATSGSSAAPHPSSNSSLAPALPFLYVLAGFTALVWLDSAAFFIIQGNPLLKAGTWQGSAHLWANACLHLAAALASAWLLRRRGLALVLWAALLALGCACLLLLDPSRLVLASIFYPIGVSFYSVALVAYPSLLAGDASVLERGRRAGWVYAVAGWMGSAMGIGMAQHLGHVPPPFVFAASAVVLLPMLVRIARHRTREMALAALVALLAFVVDRAVLANNPSPQLSQVERGRQVYISEGCIHCHSQYVRPNSPDVLMWGPVESMQELRAQVPPLIGNRRQGPDLSQVGGRRSALWLKAHFYDPPEVSGSSIMPSFAILFRDQRGADLVAYLASLHGPGTADHIAAENQWKPAPEALRSADAQLGRQLFQRDCATCHAAEGRTRALWQADFKRLPPDFAVGPFTHLPPADDASTRLERLARIAKFGIPGTDMPGHEYLSDQQIASIGLWLSQRIAQSSQQR